MEGTRTAAGSGEITLPPKRTHAPGGPRLLRARQSLRLDRWKRGLVPRVDAPRMAKAAGAVAGAAVGVGHDVVNDVVRAIGISRNPRHSEQVVQAQVVPYAPSDIVVGARGVAAHAKASNDHLPYGVEGEAAPEHIDAPDSLADHRIVGLPVAARIAGVSDLRVHGVAVLQAIQATAWVDRGIQVGRGQRETFGLPRAVAGR